MLANFDVTPSFLFLVLLACNKLQPSKTQVDCNDFPCFNGGTCIPGPPDMCSCPSGRVQPFCSISCQNIFFPCVNGTCVGDVCNCDANFAGPRCESAIAAYLSPMEITVTEGHVGRKAVTLQVCRQPSSEEVTLQVYTDTGSALPDVDFVNIPRDAPQDVTISAGQTCTPVNVFIISDLTQETMSKHFLLVLNDPQPSSSMVHFVRVHSITFITIIDDDPVNCDLDRPCFNGGTCHPSALQNLCTCPAGFVEPFCTTSCVTDPCQNGGTCNDDVCSCQPGFAGPTCQSAIAVYLSPLEVSVTEGNTGDVNIQIHLCRQQSDLPATLTVVSAQDSASTLSDFAHINADVTIPIGQVCAPVDISIVSDMTIEPTEVFHLVILTIQLPVYVVPGQRTATVTIIDNDDTEPPVISNCPISRSVSITPGTSSTSVSWVPPTATDNSGDVTLMSSDQPGDTFSLGQTTVTYTAIDGAGNTEQCQFVVTVMGDEYTKGQL